MNKWKKRVRGIRSLIETWLAGQIDPESDPVRRGRFVVCGKAFGLFVDRLKNDPGGFKWNPLACHHEISGEHVILASSRTSDAGSWKGVQELRSQINESGLRVFSVIDPMALTLERLVENGVEMRKHIICDYDNLKYNVDFRERSGWPVSELLTTLESLRREIKHYEDYLKLLGIEMTAKWSLQLPVSVDDLELRISWLKGAWK